MVTENITET